MSRSTLSGPRILVVGPALSALAQTAMPRAQISAVTVDEAVTQPGAGAVDLVILDAAAASPETMAEVIGWVAGLRPAPPALLVGAHLPAALFRALLKLHRSDVLDAPFALTDLARAAGEAGIGKLEFYSGIPGTVGGALAMNAGCYGLETKDVLIEAYALTRAGEPVVLSNAEMGFSYRKSAAAAAQGLIFTGALFEGYADDPTAILSRMASVNTRREASQPIREKTGGSTFKNPPGLSAWKLVDQAGWRGRMWGGAMFSPQHSNFLINTGEATASDLEALGEAVRADVRARLRIQLEWEIKRIGRPSA